MTMWVLVIIAVTGMTTIPGFTDVRACYAAMSDIDQKVGLLGKPIGCSGTLTLRLATTFGTPVMEYFIDVYKPRFTPGFFREGGLQCS